MTEAETTTIHVKMDKKLWVDFSAKADALNMKNSELLRKLIRAFNDNRVTITPTEPEQQLFKFD